MAPAVGFFGKLPGYGDFIQRKLSPDLVANWDNWLSQGMDTSRAQLKSNWQPTYLTAPIWHFYLQPGVLSKALVTGLMMPSVDAAGRAYPFLVCCTLDAENTVLQVSSDMAHYHRECEAFLRELLVLPRPDLTDICSYLERHYAAFTPTVRPAGDRIQLSSQAGELVRINSENEIDIRSSNDVFCAQLLKLQQLKISIWSYSATERLSNHVRYYNGMPAVEQFHSLLQG